jgi:hypothetical protein
VVPGYDRKGNFNAPTEWKLELSFDQRGWSKLTDSPATPDHTSLQHRDLTTAPLKKKNVGSGDA